MSGAAAGATAPPLKVFAIAGEPSGDALGGPLLQWIRLERRSTVFAGVGGPAMEAQGLNSLFPMGDIAVMGFLPVIRRLPQLLDRIGRTAEACIAARPDALVIIDSPDFTHRVARRVKKQLPDLPVINYVSPTVWAWRPGRAKAMRAYVDEVLAVLPFEPAAMQRLSGPRTTYVGHPLIDQLEILRPSSDEQGVRDENREVLLLPGSRHSEVTRLLPPFGAAAALISARVPGVSFTLPVAPNVADVVRDIIPSWPVKPRLVFGEGPKQSAFRRARAALAASGTVTLELALSGVPMVAAYRVSTLEAEIVRRVIQVKSVLLPNLILDRPAVPELLQKDANPERMAAALEPLVRGGPERDRQLADLRELADRMMPGVESPGRAAARIVIEKASGLPPG